MALSMSHSMINEGRLKLHPSVCRSFLGSNMNWSSTINHNGISLCNSATSKALNIKTQDERNLLMPIASMFFELHRQWL